MAEKRRKVGGVSKKITHQIMEEKNCKIIMCEIELPYNENLESVLGKIEGWDVEFWDKKKSGVLKIELTPKQ